jgi:hypothetical protein
VARRTAAHPLPCTCPAAALLPPAPSPARLTLLPESAPVMRQLIPKSLLTHRKMLLPPCIALKPPPLPPLARPSLKCYCVLMKDLSCVISLYCAAVFEPAHALDRTSDAVGFQISECMIRSPPRSPPHSFFVSPSPPSHSSSASLPTAREKSSSCGRQAGGENIERPTQITNAQRRQGSVRQSGWEDRVRFARASRALSSFRRRDCLEVL